METKTVRAPENVVEEILVVAEMLGSAPARLIERAWKLYCKSPEFSRELVAASTPTRTIRVSKKVVEEILVAADRSGNTPANLIERAWKLYCKSPELASEFRIAQKAFASDDVDQVFEILAARRERSLPE